jgi:hypothetical protein
LTAASAEFLLAKFSQSGQQMHSPQGEELMVKANIEVANQPTSSAPS